MDKNALVQHFTNTSNLGKIFLAVVVVSLVAGVGTGVIMAKNGGNALTQTVLNEAPKTAQQDNKTFKDFAEGTVQKRPTPKDPTDYVEGTHLLIRPGALPVAMTSSVVDLSKYEGKKVKVFGETQKAIKEGWLMDVGKVEEE